MKSVNVDFVVVYLEGFDLVEEFMEGVRMIYNQDEVLKDVDFVYVKNWFFYKDYGKIIVDYNDWMIIVKKMVLMNNGKLMYCLLVWRNVEVIDEVLDSDCFLVLEQVNNWIYVV